MGLRKKQWNDQCFSVCLYMESAEKQKRFHAVYDFNQLWTGKQSKQEFSETRNNDIFDIQI